MNDCILLCAASKPSMRISAFTDILHNEVIAPVCEELGYEVVLKHSPLLAIGVDTIAANRALEPLKRANLVIVAAEKFNRPLLRDLKTCVRAHTPTIVLTSPGTRVPQNFATFRYIRCDVENPLQLAAIRESLSAKIRHVATQQKDSLWHEIDADKLDVDAVNLRTLRSLPELANAGKSTALRKARSRTTRAPRHVLSQNTSRTDVHGTAAQRQPTNETSAIRAAKLESENAELKRLCVELSSINHVLCGFLQKKS